MFKTLNNIINYFTKQTKYLAGDVLLFAGKSNLSKVIAFATNSPFSHAGILWDENIVFEAEIATGVTATSALERVFNYEGEVWHLPLRRATYSLFQKQKFQAYLNSQKNRGGYDFQTLARLIIQKLKEKGIVVPAELEQIQSISQETFALFLSKAWVSQNSLSLLSNQEISLFTCSSLVAQALIEGGILPTSIRASDVTPMDLCNFFIYEKNYNKLKSKNSLPVTYNTIKLG